MSSVDTDEFDAEAIQIAHLVAHYTARWTELYVDREGWLEAMGKPLGFLLPSRSDMDEQLRYTDLDLLFCDNEHVETAIRRLIAWAGEEYPGFIMARWHAIAIKLALDNPSYW